MVSSLYNHTQLELSRAQTLDELYEYYNVHLAAQASNNIYMYM